MNLIWLLEIIRLKKKKRKQKHVWMIKKHWHSNNDPLYISLKFKYTKEDQSNKEQINFKKTEF